MEGFNGERALMEALVQWYRDDGLSDEQIYSRMAASNFELEPHEITRAVFGNTSAQ